jgi:serine protease Do
MAHGQIGGGPSPGRIFSPGKIYMTMARYLGALAGVLILAAAVQFAPARDATPAESKENSPPKFKIDEAPLAREVKAATSFAPVIKKVAPSVVNIYSTMTIKERQNPLFNDPFLRRFFGDNFGQQAEPRSHREQSLGSGVIVSSDGYILTANHVVEGADSVKVALADGEKEFDAKIIGTDPASDIAVLKVEMKKNLPSITLADSDKLEVGDLVLAVGNPFAVGQTVTMGIVSAVGRGGFGLSGYENFIQTDAAINPGNSGGALVDAEGRLVGINTAILTRSGGSQGVGFAVPVNMARQVMNQLVEHGKVTRGFLGVKMQPLTPELAKAFNLPDESSGVLVGEVTPNSAAERAGIKDGDVIIEVNGKKVTDTRTLQLLVSQTAPGTKTTVKILRGEPGQKPLEKTLTATLKELPAEGLAGNEQTKPGERNSAFDALDGVEVTDLDARTQRQMGLPINLRGALVTQVDPDSNAAKASPIPLRQGDVVLELDHQPVRSADDAVRLSEKAKGDQILLRIWSASGGGKQFVVVDNRKHK